MELFLVEDKELFILYSTNHSCWRPDDACNESSHGIDIDSWDSPVSVAETIYWATRYIEPVCSTARYDKLLKNKIKCYIQPFLNYSTKINVKIHFRSKIWNIQKTQWKHSYLTFLFVRNGLAPTTNKYCDFDATLIWSDADEKFNL